MPEEEEDDNGHGDDHLDQGGLEVVDGPQDQLGAVIDRHHTHSLGQAGGDLAELVFDPFDHIQSVLALAHHHNPRDHLALAVEFGHAPALFRAEADRADVLDPDRFAPWSTGKENVFEIGQALGITTAPDHVLGAAELDQPAAGLGIAAAHRLDHAADREAVGLQPVGIDIDLILLGEAAHRGHFRHSAHRLEVVAQVPVLGGAQISEAVFAGGVDQGVLVDPAESGGIGAEFGPHPLGQAGEHPGEVFQGTGTGPVDIGAFFEDHIDIGVAEIGEAAHRLDLGSAEHGADDRVGDLVLDDVGAAVPAGIDDHLGVAEVGDGVQHQALHRPPAGQAGGGDQEKDDEAVLDRPINDAVQHARGPRVLRVGSAAL